MRPPVLAKFTVNASDPLLHVGLARVYCATGRTPEARAEIAKALALKPDLQDFINNECGGMKDDMKLKAVIPGGSSVPVLTAAECVGVLLDYESLLKAGSMLGSGGMIVLGEITNMAQTLSVIADFYAHESCGQCTPCREGTGWAAKVLRNLIAGKGKKSDINLLLKIADMMEGKTICPLADADVMPIRSFVTKFRSEFEALCLI